MIRKIIRKTISVIESEQNASILSKEYVLENRTQEKKVLELIKKLQPYNVGKDLIRLGAKRDGGYLVPDDLVEIEACFSPGVSTVSEFEKDCFKRGMKIFLADKSVDKPKIGLNKISIGDVIEVITSDPISTKDIPFFLKNSRHILKKLENDEKNFRFLILLFN